MKNINSELSQEELCLLNSNEFYKGFVIPKSPIKFSEKFKDFDIDRVELYNIRTYNTQNTKEFYGFVGAFSYIDNKITSIDGDSYNPDMIIYGYDYWSNSEEGILRGLSILVKEW